MKKPILVLLFICILIHSAGFSQESGEYTDLISKKFLLKHSIYNIGEEITTVYRDWIQYSRKKVPPYKYADNHAFYDSTVIISSVEDKDEYVKIVCSVVVDDERIVPEDFRNVPVLLKKYKWTGIDEPFELVFTQDFTYHNYKREGRKKEPKTREELIKFYGYPPNSWKDGENTVFYYNRDFLGFETPSGFHDVWFRVNKDGIIVDEGGRI